MQVNQGDLGFTVLLVDDEPGFCASIRRFMRPDGLSLLEANGGEAALEILSRHHVDVALVDIRMPQMDGLELLLRIRSSYPDVSVIMMTSYGDTATIVQAVKAGATDFIEKDVSVEAIRNRLLQAKKIWELERDNRALKAQAVCSFSFDRLIGESPSMARLKEVISQVGPSDASVLIEGETGSGKELVAQALHHQSSRRTGPFIVVDCGSISESLIESELFGHVKGAYTGAHESDMGLFRSAEGGTVFLDEVGEMPMFLQVKLLRVIQEREVRPVGSARSQHVDIRVIAATNRRLDEQVKRGGFREDLFYRLAVVTLAVPPLRERSGDMPPLSAFFLKRLRNDATAVQGIAPETMACLERHVWPGNVRELENVIRRALVLSKGPLLQPEDLPPDFRHGKLREAEVAVAETTKDRLESYEKEAVLNALEKSGGSRRQAARLLGIGEATLYRKLKAFDIK
ncbi:MAG: sigma-54 dependent transcriptional regulator [Spirochaetota bacterium]